MRSDMHKVIVERPRMLRSGWTNRKTALRLDVKRSALAADAGDDYDSGPHRASSARHEKYLNENLAPLRRYLESQVGRPWDKVYSEIRAGIPGNAVGLHVMQHVEDFVAVNVFFEDGMLRRRYRFGGSLPVDGMYVHPRTRLLRKTKSVTRRSWWTPRPAEAELNFCPQTLPNAFEKINGIWYRVVIRINDPRLLVRRSDGTMVRAGDQSGFVRMETLSKQQCDRKTVRKIENGEFGRLYDRTFAVRLLD
jgi:hypothetical protein